MGNRKMNWIIERSKDWGLIYLSPASYKFAVYGDSIELKKTDIIGDIYVLKMAGKVVMILRADSHRITNWDDFNEEGEVDVDKANCVST